RHPSSGGSRTTLLRGQSDDPPSGADRRPSSGGRPTPSSGGSRTTLLRGQSDAHSAVPPAVGGVAGRQGSCPPSGCATLWVSSAGANDLAELDARGRAPMFVGGLSLRCSRVPRPVTGLRGRGREAGHGHPDRPGAPRGWRNPALTLPDRAATPAGAL